jgi:hypothetical protein
MVGFGVGIHMFDSRNVMKAIVPGLALLVVSAATVAMAQEVSQQAGTQVLGVDRGIRAEVSEPDGAVQFKTQPKSAPPASKWGATRNGNSTGSAFNTGGERVQQNAQVHPNLGSTIGNRESRPVEKRSAEGVRDVGTRATSGTRVGGEDTSAPSINTSKASIFSSKAMSTSNEHSFALGTHHAVNYRKKSHKVAKTDAKRGLNAGGSAEVSLRHAKSDPLKAEEHKMQ